MIKNRTAYFIFCQIYKQKHWIYKHKIKCIFIMCILYFKLNLGLSTGYNIRAKWSKREFFSPNKIPWFFQVWEKSPSTFSTFFQEMDTLDN